MYRVWNITETIVNSMKRIHGDNGDALMQELNWESFIHIHRENWRRGFHEYGSLRGVCTYVPRKPVRGCMNINACAVPRHHNYIRGGYTACQR